MSYRSSPTGWPATRGAARAGSGGWCCSPAPTRVDAVVAYLAALAGGHPVLLVPGDGPAPP